LVLSFACFILATSSTFCTTLFSTCTGISGGGGAAEVVAHGFTIRGLCSVAS
jgi:hypothetical protein